MKTLFIYPTNRQAMYQGWKKGKEPSTLMYGFCELKKEGHVVNFQDTFGLKKKLIKFLFLPFEIIFFKLVGISLHFDHIFSQLGKIKESDTIISTSDSSSIPLLLLKKTGFLQKQKIICLSVDLINRANDKPIFRLLKNIYGAASCVVVFSKEEEKQYENKWHLKNVKYVQFGIDADFFRDKIPDNHDDYILTIGRDRSRDYGFFMEIARIMPEQKFAAICSQKNISGINVPSNVELIIDADYETIKRWLTKSFCFVLPLHEIRRASGQIAFLEAVALNLPIIVSPVNSIKDNYEFEEQNGVYLLENDIVQWVDKINKVGKENHFFSRSRVPSIHNLAKTIKI